MPRFQSRLFNWIDRSLPVQLGRNVRRLLDQKFRQVAGLPIQDLPRLLAYQVARAALYPVYLMASIAKRTFPALNWRRPEARENLQSQVKAGLLVESENFAENFTENIKKPINQEIDLIDTEVDSKNDFSNLEIPFFLRPLAKFLDWINRTRGQLDHNIMAIVKGKSDRLTTLEDSELESKWVANRIFAEIWQQQINQKQAEINSLKERNGLTENVALGKNTRLEQLRRLIEAAIAYFFGKQASSQDQDLPDSEQVPEVLGGENSDAEALPSPRTNQRFGSAKSGDRLSNPQTNSGKIKENAPLAESTNLQRLRDLIAAAIDYFIGKRSLDGVPSINVDGAVDGANDHDNINGNQPDLLSQQILDQMQSGSPSSANYVNRDQSFAAENSNFLKTDNQLERLRKIIEAAIAYFFTKTEPTLEGTSDITSSGSAWLTMEDLFRDDNGPWPIPLEYESVSYMKSPDRHTIHSSGELQNFETTTTQISQDQLQGGLSFEEEDLLYQSPNPVSDNGDRPLRAWLEAQAIILGYAYNPVMTVILWVDGIVLKIENLMINLWQGLILFPKRLINFIRYGK